MRLVQFDGTAWQPIGDVIENAFIGSTGQTHDN
jgi:branched-chain amino acid transport system substrate-binding protein